MRARSNSYCVCTFSRPWSVFTLLRTRSVLQPDTVCSCRKLANDDTATELPQTGIFPQTPIASDALIQPYTPACHPSGSETGGATSQPQSRGHRHRPAGHPASTSRVKQELLVLGAHGCLLLEDSLTASACTGAVHSAYMQYIFCTKQQRTPCGRSSDTYAVHSLNCAALPLSVRSTNINCVSWPCSTWFRSMELKAYTKHTMIFMSAISSTYFQTQDSVTFPPISLSAMQVTQKGLHSFAGLMGARSVRLDVPTP